MTKLTKKVDSITDISLFLEYIVYYGKLVLNHRTTRQKNTASPTFCLLKEAALYGIGLTPINLDNTRALRG